MGTRSLTYVYDGDEPVVCMYGQFDGYPSGLGADLADFLHDGKVINGIPFGAKGKMFNGMGCLAAQLVAKFKVGVGNFYLYPVKQNQDCWQEYEYHIYENKVIVKGHSAFEGTWEQFAEFCHEDD
jgi:hypothetical protein